jgi:DNA-binding response OmpR family regulator
MTDGVFEVLIVEDEAVLREQIKQLLVISGYQVRVAEDVASAIVALEQQPPDVILSDLMLPDLPAYALLKYVQERWPDLPVLVMTAYASMESAVEVLKQGAYDYLLKPVTAPELTAALGRATNAVSLQRSRARAEHLRHIAEVALTLAHEINNPLAIIMGELQLQLETGGADMPGRRAMEISLESAHRIAGVVRRISALQEVAYQEHGGIRLIDLGTSIGA